MARFFMPTNVQSARKHIARLNTIEALETYQARIDKIWEAGALTDAEFLDIDDAFVERVYQIERDE